MDVERFEEAIEDALWQLEIQGDERSALSAYERVTGELEAAVGAGAVAEADACRVLSYGYLRQANIVRVQGDLAKARALGERSVSLGRASGDSLALARALLNHAGTLAMLKDPDLARVLREALCLFQAGSCKEHVQGVGWHWILVADLCEAELLPGGTAERIAAAEKALGALTPIENWQGVARAWSALERAHQRDGDLEAAALARKRAREATMRTRTEKR